VDEFGPRVLDRTGEIDRAELARRVFADPADLARLEAVTHPLVREAAEARIAATRSDLVAYEAIRLIESGAAARCDEVWVVTATRAARVARLAVSRGMSPEDAKRRISAQPEDAFYRENATVVIENDGTPDALRCIVAREVARLRGSL